MKYIGVILLSLMVFPAARAAETNDVYVTDDGFLSIRHSDKLEEAKKSNESLPAERFPEGNWGAITNGFQLSLRFEKKVFTNGEPIRAIMLLRNTTTNRLLAYTAAFSPTRGPIGLKVLSESGGVIPPISNEIDTISSRGRSLSPRTQHKYVEYVERTFAVQTNGNYKVRARLAVPSPMATIESDWAEFTIRNSETK